MQVVKTGLTSYALRSPDGSFCIPINPVSSHNASRGEWFPNQPRAVTITMVTVRTVSSARMDKPAEHRMGRPYGTLVIELAVDFAIMYLVMYAMIATLEHFHFNINNLYMTLMMVAPMAIVMLVAMMYPLRRLNLIVGAGAAVMFVLSFVAMRSQAGVGDSEFLRAMIPHHSGAILMCEEASLSDSEIQELYGRIVEAQKREIAQMETILARLRR